MPLGISELCQEFTERSVSMDYPFYEKLVAARHPAARWWRVGDVLYYLGLLSASAGVAFWSTFRLAVDRVRGDAHFSWLTDALVPFCAGVLVFLLGATLKSRSYVLAERDGIRPDKA